MMEDGNLTECANRDASMFKIWEREENRIRIGIMENREEYMCLPPPK